MIDGNDADVVYRTAQAAYDKARAGEGPSLIECLTYRYSGHSRADPAKYRPEGELDRWKLRDPIKIYRERLLQFGVKEKTIADIDAASAQGGRRRHRSLQGRAQAAARYPHHRRLRRWGLGMAELTYRDAVIRGIAQEMARDPDVVFLGEDVAKAGGVFKATVGLFEQFGPLRVRDTPISEQAIMGAAMGAAMTGLKPIAEIMFSDFFAVCFDYIANEFPKSRYMTNGQVKVPAGGTHRQRRRLPFRRPAFSQSVENWCMMIPGLKVVAPSIAGRRHRLAGGGGARSRSGDFLRAQVAVRHQGRGAGRRDRRHARHRQDRAARQGRHHPRAGADGAARAGGGRKAQGGTRHRCEVVDVRSLVPLDTQTILGSVAKTHRLFTVEENPRLCGWGAEIVSIIADEAFYDLDGPPVRITTPHIPLPAAEFWKTSCCRRRSGSSRR